MDMTNASRDALRETIPPVLRRLRREKRRYQDIRHRGGKGMRMHRLHHPGGNTGKLQVPGGELQGRGDRDYRLGRHKGRGQGILREMRDYDDLCIQLLHRGQYLLCCHRLHFQDDGRHRRVQPIYCGEAPLPQARLSERDGQEPG